LETIAKLDARSREDALGHLMVICGLRGIETQVEEEIRKVPVLNSLLDHKVLGREFKKGLQQGEARGEARGEAKLLRRQLEYRFKKLPKWVADKLAAATPAQLEAWQERLLEKKSLAAIFGLFTQNLRRSLRRNYSLRGPSASKS